MASLTHCRRNLFADGPQGNQTTTGGLTDRGRAAINRMNELGIVVDLVHINPVGYFEILELAKQPLVLSHTSHTNFAAVDPSPVRRIRGTAPNYKPTAKQTAALDEARKQRILRPQRRITIDGSV